MRSYLHLLFAVVLCFGLAFAQRAQAQNQTTLSGQVVDTNSGQPLSGASVSAGTDKTQTDAKGRFTLNVDSSATSLTIDALGYDLQFLPTQGWSGSKVIGLKPSSETLPEVLVQSFRNNDDLLHTAGAVGILTEEDMDRGTQVNAAPILDTVAGVQVDQSTMEDSRISIRGEGLRSTYGIRDVALFLDGIPLNEADNFGRIEGLDLYNIGNAEIVKGPDSSVYGAGVGGAINFSSLRPNAGETSLSSDLLFGDFGLQRESGSIKADLGNADVVLSYANQDFAGWETHTQDYKTFATGTGTFHPSDKDTLTVLVNQSDEQAMFTTAETLSQFQNNAQAGGNNSNLESLYNIHRYELWTRFGVNNTYEISDQWENKSSFFSAEYTLDHPYGYGYSNSYLEESMQEFGGRSELTFRPTTGDVATRITGGAELANEYSLANYYTNSVAGAVSFGHLDSVDDNYESHINLFLEAELTLEKNTVFTAGFNYNNTTYSVNNTFSATDNTFYYGSYTINTPTGAVTNGFQANSFRAAVNHTFDDQYSVYADVAQGFSPPAFGDDTSSVNGGLLLGLSPQTATQYEIGTRGYLFDKHFNFDLALYESDLNNELIEYTFSQNGQSYTQYENAGSTTHQGAELSLSYILLDSKDGFFNLVKPWATYAYQNYQFGSGLVGGVSYQNQALPGNSVNNVNVGIDVDTHPGFYVNANYLWKDAAALNNANNVWDPAYGLFAFKVGFKRQIDQFKFDLYGGAYNLFNALYNAYPELNSTTGQYYEPGLPQNFYAGTSVAYLF